MKYDVIDLDLAIARVDEVLEVGASRLSVVYLPADAVLFMRLNSVNAPAIRVGGPGDLTTGEFIERIYVTNEVAQDSAQLIASADLCVSFGAATPAGGLQAADLALNAEGELAVRLVEALDAAQDSVTTHPAGFVGSEVEAVALTALIPAAATQSNELDTRGASAAAVEFPAAMTSGNISIRGAQNSGGPYKTITGAGVVVGVSTIVNVPVAVLPRFIVLVGDAAEAALRSMRVHLKRAS